MSLSERNSADAMLARLEGARGTPLRAMIEISDRCNEVCVHCYQVQGQKGEMTTAEVKRVLDDLAQLGVLVLTVSGGEATLRSDCLEIITYARELGFVVRLFTNGLTMSETLATELARLAIQDVEISLYSHRAELHDFVTGVPGSFTRTVAGIRHLVARGVVVIVKTPVMSINERDIPAYTAFVKELGADCQLDAGGLMPREDGERVPGAFDPTPVGERATDRHVAPFRSPQPEGREHRDLGETLCGAGRYLHVEPNGAIRPCTMLDLDLGDARAEGLMHARAENVNLRELLALSWRSVHGCRGCDLQAACSRCYAKARAEVGDALGPYPSACAKARHHFERDHGAPPRILAPEGRDPLIGPYRRVGPDTFEAVPDEITPEDEALAARLGWVRRAPLPAPKLAARPGELIQIRRPGRKAPREERVPGPGIEQALAPAQERT